jgi:hypothetical protein
VKSVFHRRGLSRSLLLALAVSACIVNSMRVDGADIPGVVRQGKPAVVQIVALDFENKPLKSGTGFFISSDGNLLTNYHVVSGAHSLMAKAPSGAIYVFKEIIAFSPKADVALLSFDVTGVAHLDLSSTATAVEGQRVLVIGNPEGGDTTFSDGIISAFRDNRSMFQITAPISQGSSGSPVLDESGRVLGIATLVSQEGQSLNVAVSAETIRASVLSEASKDRSAQETAATEPTVSLNSLNQPTTESTPQSQSTLILKLDRALETHDWGTVSTYVANGVTDYFGHRNASAAFIRKDMEGDARRYRWTHTYPDTSTFRRSIKNGVVYESVEEQTEALEYGGQHHQAYCLFEITYEDRNPPTVLTLSLKVLK